MPRSTHPIWRLPSGIALLAFASTIATAASAQTSAQAAQPAAGQTPNDQLDAYKHRIDADEKALAEQARELAEQKAMLETQKQELDQLRASMDTLESVRAAGEPSASPDSPIATAIASNDQGGGTPPPPPSGSPPTNQPVGEAPPAQPPPAAALPVGINVLTPPGRFIWENGVDYQNSASNRLVFEGVEITNAVLIGVIQANQTENNSAIYWSNFRYGVIPRLEVELDVPYVLRTEQVTTVQTAQNQYTQSYLLNGNGLGDIQAIARYQITSGAPGTPILIANLEVKSNTGRGPYDVEFNAGGVADSLPVGSGFWAVQPSLSWIYPLDPVVLFGNVGYMHSFGYAIDKKIGAAYVQGVQPGDGISAVLGFSFALNQRFSYSLGYMDDFFFGTNSYLSGVKAFTTSLEAGSFMLGGSYHITKHLNLNLNFEFGVTPDAPNTTIMLRLPYVF